MIHAILPYYPRKNGPDGLERILADLRRQTEPPHLIVVDAANTGMTLADGTVLRGRRRLYWADCMQLAYEYFCSHDVAAEDIVCVLNDDLFFDTDFLKRGSRLVSPGTAVLSRIYEGDTLVDGGIEIDWSKKSFRAGTRTDCFSPRGMFMTVGDFRASGGFRPALLPHYLADYEFSIRCLKKGLRAVVEDALRITTFSHHSTAGVFSRLNPRNPVYWTIFLMLCCPRRYLFVNLLRVWIWWR